MAESSTALFNEPEAFEATAREVGNLRLYLTGSGPFRVRLTQVVLGAMRLSAVDESQPRIAVLTVPADTVLVTLPAGPLPGPVWGGIATRPGDMLTHSPGRRVLGWTQGRCRWIAIWIPALEMARYGRALVGDGLTVPPGTRRWRPQSAALKTLQGLHAAAITTARTHPDAFAHAEATRGLSQQLIHALVECLSDGGAVEDAPALRRHQDIALRFEELLCAEPDRVHRPESISGALGVSCRGLGAVCREQLGMGPGGYIRLHRMHRARCALRCQQRDEKSVSEIARRHGFQDVGRFARAYRDRFGELPSATLRRGSLPCEASHG